MSHPPLHGVKVLELAQIMAGPTCGLMLADLGAEVIKVEKLPGGDDARNYREENAKQISVSYGMLNRNKRSLAINLKDEQGRAAFFNLVRDADVVIENYRLGTMEKLGLGYDVLSAVNPRLILCSISGYGRTGPMADKGGFDLIAQAFSGLLSVTGNKGGDPVKGGNSVADINAGILAVIGILAALLERARTGQGQSVDTSLFEASLQQMYWFAAMYFGTGVSAGPSGSAHPLIAPYQAFRASDGWITLGGANQRNWEKIARRLAHPEWIENPLFKDGPSRKTNEQVLVRMLSDILIHETSDHWIREFEDAGVPVGPVHSIGDVLGHPQTAARNMVVETDHPVMGPMKSLGFPIKFSRSRLPPPRPAALLGEQTEEILREAGVSEDAIQSLLNSGSVRVTR